MHGNIPPPNTVIRAQTWLRRCTIALIAASPLAWAGVPVPVCEVMLDVPGIGVGNIPDGALGGAVCGDPGAPLEVSFPVPAVPGLVLVDIDVTLQMSHPWAGDVTATLSSPSSFAHTLFGRVGAVSANACGDSSDFNGPYVFSDLASPPHDGLWQAAIAAAGSSAVISPGSYFTTNSGGAGATSPMPATSLRSVFGGMGDASGAWTLRVTDGGEGDSGLVTGATLSLCLAALVEEVFADGFEGPVF